MSGEDLKIVDDDKKRTFHTRAFHSRIPTANNTFLCDKRSKAAAGYAHAEEKSRKPPIRMGPGTIRFERRASEKIGREMCERGSGGYGRAYNARRERKTYAEH